VISISPDAHSDYLLLFNFYLFAINFEKITKNLLHKPIRLFIPFVDEAMIGTPQQKNKNNPYLTTPDLQLHLSVTVWGLTQSDKPSITIDQIEVIGFPFPCYHHPCQNRYIIKGSDILRLQKEGKIPTIFDIIAGNIVGK